MQYPNKLNDILVNGLQIENLKPTEKLLEQLGNISLKRFSLIQKNSGKDLTAKEKEGIENWLYQITGQRFDIYKDGADKLNQSRQTS